MASLLRMKCANSGQSWIAPNRVLVQRSVHDAFLERVTEHMWRQVGGPGLESASTYGPLIQPSCVRKLREKIQEALSCGARIRFQASLEERLDSSRYYPLMLVENVAAEMRLARQEVFGPVIAVTSFEKDQEALELANDTPFGLAAYLFTASAGRARRFVHALEFGAVGVNDARPVHPRAPFGGFKLSGLGRARGEEGLFPFLESRGVSWGGGLGSEAEWR